ncbi:MAG: class I SAM-dependent methyltransferase [Acidobacteriota bacterium]|nr:class I SAM-dependent methyltransferase [Acidobacteriota bacterium]
MKNEKYIPALSYDWLTPFYDTAVRLTTREKVFKKALVEQAKIKANHRVLDLACGTGTLTILIKNTQPQAKVVGIDGDARILEIAKTKAKQSDVEIQFDEGMSVDLPYEDESFDSVVSSLFFHHLTRENKLKTLREVKRILKPNGEFHIADWGLPANLLMKGSSYLIQLLDGSETTADSFSGLLPKFMADAGFDMVEETNNFNSLFGTIRLHKSRKP